MKFFKKFFTISLILLLSINAIALEPKIPTDKEISIAVEQEMLFNKTTSSHLIDVTTIDGIVTLKGSVNNMLEMDKAVQIARTVKGVRGVINQIDVLIPPMQNDELEKDVTQALLRDPATEIYEISADADNGLITLNGMVDSWQEKRLVEYVVKGVKGVKGIKNLIAVDIKTQRSDVDIENDIEKAIYNDVRVDGALIDVTVSEGKVYLSGVVGSANERIVADAISWTNGVISVDHSDLKVKQWTRDDNLRMQKYNIRSDMEIKDAILDAFEYDPRVASFYPDVMVRNGEVTLSGKVSNLKAKRAAESDAKNIIGVISVKNYIKVRTENIPSNEKLETSINSALHRDPMISRWNVKVSANNGVVYLDGTADSQYEKFRIEDIASKEKGVVAIQNNIKIRDANDYYFYDYYDWNSYYPIYQVDTKTAYIDDEILKKEIENRLWWSPYVNENEINVQVQNGKAILSGSVETQSEKKYAVIKTLEAGPKKVENNITVELPQTGD
jgi:osmotically-inducible protein OsmY